MQRYPCVDFSFYGQYNDRQMKFQFPEMKSWRLRHTF